MTDKLLPCPLCGGDASLETGVTADVCGNEIHYVTCVDCSAQADPHDWQTRPAPETNLPGDAPVLFGLEAQGHIPAVEAALKEGVDWQEIGRRIGWDGETAKQYYERHLARKAASEGKP